MIPTALENRITGTFGIDVSINFAETSSGPTVVDHHNPAMKLVIQGQEVDGCIVDGGSDVNVISTTTCEQLGISNWEVPLFAFFGLTWQTPDLSDPWG